ncbi:hypothetical protein [Ruania zhangjianzhongii]|uniref:hypothetical protein n=1 Tax=Ruania zhangjianzhongii TaxID=2603206 RepID=UPI0011C8FA5B|nr:hypothetical protein [Ruania zhangjianzhongii]
METDADRLAERIIAAESDRGLGAVQLLSGRALEPFSTAGHEGAQNLVNKALAALETGDADRARRYLRTAARLPFDEREQSHPLAWIAHMELFNEISDLVEELDERDSSWLDLATTVLADADEDGRAELRAVLVTIEHDYRMRKQENRALRTVIAGLPEQAPLHERHVDEPELVAGALSILQATLAYGRAAEALFG